MQQWPLLAAKTSKIITIINLKAYIQNGIHMENTRLVLNIWPNELRVRGFFNTHRIKLSLFDGYRISPNKRARARCKTQWGGVYFYPKTTKHHFFKICWLQHFFTVFQSLFLMPGIIRFDTLFVYIVYFRFNVVSYRWRIKLTFLAEKKNVTSQKFEGGASIRAGAFIRRNTVVYTANAALIVG